MSFAYQVIRASLDSLHDQHQHETLSDPIQFPIRFSRSKDQEIVALISALYAFGNVKMIFRTLENICAFLGEEPEEKIRSLDRKKMNSFQFAKHRWVTPEDTKSLLLLIQKVIQNHSSLEQSFMRFYQPEDPTLEKSISEWMTDLKITLKVMQKKPLTRGQKFLLSSPDGGSTSKRILMFFRWMVRSEEPDLGLWKKISSSQLLMPLDAHLFRFSKYLGFTKRKQHGWKAVIESTQHFRKINPQDPVRYDFALARLGILNLCLHKFQPQTCNPCLIKDHCSIFQKNIRRSKSISKEVHGSRI